MVPGIGVGRVVHFIPGNGRGFNDPQKHIAAVIVGISETNSDIGMVNLRLLLDGTNDHPYWKDQEWSTSVCYDETATKGYSWHWPERVDQPVSYTPRPTGNPNSL